ncbi:hypothetical protein J3Q64DRAFT_1739942 [Phycomyces blakesleeanus]
MQYKPHEIITRQVIPPQVIQEPVISAPQEPAPVSPQVSHHIPSPDEKTEVHEPALVPSTDVQTNTVDSQGHTRSNDGWRWTARPGMPNRPDSETVALLTDIRREIDEVKVNHQSTIGSASSTAYTATTSASSTAHSTISTVTRLCHCTKGSTHQSNCLFHTTPDPLAFPLPRLSIESFSLTHNKDALKTYRRMASKTNDSTVQMTYCTYLTQVAKIYHHKPDAVKTHRRLIEEVEYWVERLAKANLPDALIIKGRWHLQGPSSASTDLPSVGQAYQRVQLTKAFKAFQAAAKGGSAEAHVGLAEYWRACQDIDKSIECYKVAASKGHTTAAYTLAKIFLYGQYRQQKDSRLGLEYLQQAADGRGPDSGEPAYMIGCIYSGQLDLVNLASDPFLSHPHQELALHYRSKAQALGLATQD